ncbi:uncharacterized protein LOC111798846 [Cucurbita pepo subsp. pepo]|uniref:uncharacterized protein LOC111798846 n=1 Tax=Cucurbita pepo subsp. pepo TaxID=3664 RepID=UPI000C9D91D5|nr:uncharacterized protein LOC111798846 [Cucurbita pepo subsp. pepo]XP_023537963.1 uncharacterized protein LOC111798846 [Cucurbita pepo subsp. pepo]
MGSCLRRESMYSRCCLLSRLEGCSSKPCCSFLQFSGKYLRALIVLVVDNLKLLFHRRSCRGRCTGPALGDAMDGLSTGLRVEDQEAKKQCLPENFASSSMCEMDNSTVWSQRSMASAQSHDSHNNVGSSTEFVNSGLLLWNETRKQWVGNKTSKSQKQVREPKISWNATYDSLLTTNKPFPEAIPLAEMIEFLVDVWEQEGLYD